VPAGNVLCINCGHHLGIGVSAETVVRVRKAGRAGVALAVAGAASVVGGLVWAGIVVATGYEVGIVAWGIGLLCGVAIVLVTDERNERMGAAAAGLAFLGLLIGKLLIVQWGVVPALAEEIASEPKYLYPIALDRMVEARELAPDEMAEMEADDDEIPDAIQSSIEEKVKGRVSRMSADEKKALARETAERVVSSMGYLERIQAVSSFYDVLWVILALASAWKLGSGQSSEN